MSFVKVSYKGSEFEVEAGKRVIEFLKERETATSEIITASINGKLCELGTPITEAGEVRAYTFDQPEGKEVFWHSTSHIMAVAVKRLFPDVKVTIGPAIEEGFYYDFDKPTPFTDEDIPRIEEEMMKVIKEEVTFTRQEMSKKDAVKLFSEMEEPYKLEILEGITDSVVSIYKTEKFVDLCRGPHIGLAKKIKAVKLLKVAGAYWRGDEKNKMLQRIYGISFPKKEMLEEYLGRIEEAKLRDHRKLGKELDLFSTHEEFGPGLIYWHPKGAIIRKEIEDFWRAEHLRRDYDLLYTPHVAKIDLWHTSGHTGFYKESMYPSMIMDEQEYLIKPMNCPFHILIYKSNPKSYRDLPLRWAEMGTVYRYEKSGTLHGLMRVRGFTQDDAHIFLRDDQLENELMEIIDIITFILKTFGFESYEVYLSTMPPDHIGETAVWQRAENALKDVLTKAGLTYQVDEGGGAFYGPKIDIKIKDALNRVWQCSTVQVDFNLPERFNMTYTGKDGKDHRPIMIHRALLGSFERFFGVLIEHYKGAFPVWISPKQVAVLTITERCDEYAQKLISQLKAENIRVAKDFDSEKIGAKIRKATMEKVPYMLIIGDKEVESGTVSVRKRTGEEEKGVNFEAFKAMVAGKIRTKDNTI